MFALRNLTTKLLKVRASLSYGVLRRYPLNQMTKIEMYTTKPNAENQPRLRYLFYMFLFSSGALFVAGTQLDKKKPKTSFSEKEFAEHEESGLKRRLKIIKPEDRDKYKFYVVPYVHNQDFIKRLEDVLSGNQVKIIDPEEIMDREIKDESSRYSFLLQDLKANGKPLPNGLITALVKDEVKSYLNTRNGTFDTNFILKNYPQTTDEAIKFENDIADIQKCIVLHYDMINELKKDKGKEMLRLVNNVVGYFNTVNKSLVINARHDELDDKLQAICVEFV